MLRFHQSIIGQWMAITGLILSSSSFGPHNNIVVVDAQGDCTVCADGADTLPNVDGCDVLEELITNSTTSDECGFIQLIAYQSDCCRVAPSGVCTLCPDGASFNAATVIPSFTPDGEDTVCADILSDNRFLDTIDKKGVCEDTLLRRSSVWCQCPDVQRQCSLCPGGASPPDPTKVDKVFTNRNCATYEFFSTFYTASECVQGLEFFFEFDAATFCDCPNTVPPTVCSLCQDGEEVILPNIKPGNEEYTCGELEFAMSLLPTTGECITRKTVIRANGVLDECCGTSVIDDQKSSAPLTTMTMTTTTTNTLGIQNGQMVLSIIAFLSLFILV